MANQDDPPSLTARSKVSYCKIIRQRLYEVNEQTVNLFRATPFGPWLDLPLETGDASLVTRMLQREVSDPNAEIEQLTFDIEGHRRVFGRQEFMLITGLTFGLAPNIRHAIGDTLITRLFPRSVPARPIRGQPFRVRVKEVVKVWDESFFRLNDEDKVKIALIMMVELVFLGKQPKSYASDEVISAVEDLDAFSEYPWGSYIWSSTYRHMKGAFSRRFQVSSKMSLSGFLLAFNIWILEMFPVSHRRFTHQEGVYPRGIRWTRIPKALVKTEVDPFFRFPKRHRIPRVALVPDAFELQQQWYISSVEWFQHPSSHRPQKRARRGPVGGDPSDDDDDDDDDEDDGDGDGDGDGRGGDDGRGGFDGDQQIPEFRRQAQPDDAGAGPSHGYVHEDPVDYSDKWMRLETLETNYTEVSREQKKQREDIDKLTKEIERMQMGGRHSYSGGMAPPPFVQEPPRLSHHVPAWTGGFESLFTPPADPMHNSQQYEPPRPSHQVPEWMGNWGSLFAPTPSHNYPYTSFVASSFTARTMERDGEQSWLHSSSQAVHMYTPVRPERLSYGEQDIQHVSLEPMHIDPEPVHVEPEPEPEPEPMHVEPETHHVSQENQLVVSTEVRGKKSPRPQREKRPASGRLPPFTVERAKQQLKTVWPPWKKNTAAAATSTVAPSTSTVAPSTSTVAPSTSTRLGPYDDPVSVPASRIYTKYRTRELEPMLLSCYLVATVDRSWWGILLGIEDDGYLSDMHIDAWVTRIMDKRDISAEWAVMKSGFVGMMTYEQDKESAKLCISGLPEVYIPVCIHPRHWFLVDLDLLTMRMAVYDSYRCPSLQEQVNALLRLLKRGLQEVFTALNQPTRAKQAEELFWYFPSHIPQQSGVAGDCGVWLCRFLSELVSGIAPRMVDDPAAAARDWRKHMAEQFFALRINMDVSDLQDIRKLPTATEMASSSTNPVYFTVKNDKHISDNGVLIIPAPFVTMWNLTTHCDILIRNGNVCFNMTMMPIAPGHVIISGKLGQMLREYKLDKADWLKLTLVHDRPTFGPLKKFEHMFDIEEM
ncbi:hypothetical protein OSB04_001724 [Centaurea solstitialis]|uniref:Ubiquitin-like protease family profile domain-containing protein n=1 Tax=Centaurea solstitialis TaxID=347529 RepID=A0AA38TZ30_9ASTR|nr:hypothetical protein OSB04_001724 [Centaurea solstitialis]